MCIRRHCHHKYPDSPIVCYVFLLILIYKKNSSLLQHLIAICTAKTKALKRFTRFAQMIRRSLSYTQVTP